MIFIISINFIIFLANMVHFLSPFGERYVIFDLLSDQMWELYVGHLGGQSEDTFGSIIWG
jgi:hypothetical protein